MTIPATEQPWRDRIRLAALLRGWRRLAPCALFRVLTGDGWVELQLAGEDRRALFLAARPGANLLFDHAGPLPRTLREALAPAPRSALASHLDGARLTGAGLMPQDLVAALRCERPDGREPVLLFQLFGPRGNAVLLDADERVLWSLHRPIHGALTTRPAPEVWTGEGAPAGEDGHRGGGRVVRRFRALGLERLSRQIEGDLGTHLAGRMRAIIKQQRRLLANLEHDLATVDAGEDARRDAEALAANLHLWRPGLAHLEVVDPRDNEKRVIALDPARDGSANLNALFNRARRAARGRQRVAERRREAQGRLAELLEAERSLAEASALAPAAVAAEGEEIDLHRLTALRAWVAAHGDLVGPRRRRGVAAPDAPTRPFRRYRIEESWEVWVGRSSAENDLLTHRHAGLGDLWFHAQGVSGSHVILRTNGHPETVPKRIVAKAAALAALHSKARHAAIVPVMVAQRRYVRKPRKSPPGTATCLRYDSLFVEPALPAGTEAI